MSDYWFYKPHGIILKNDRRGNNGSFWESAWGLRVVLFTHVKWGKPDQEGLFMSNIYQESREDLVDKLLYSKDYQELPSLRIIYLMDKKGRLFRNFEFSEDVNAPLRKQEFIRVEDDGKIVWRTRKGLYPVDKFIEITEDEFNMKVSKILMMRELVK